MILKRIFFNRHTLKVAQDLLGCYLVRKHRGKIIKARIIETEAYRGENDLACHASKGRTKRTETLYSTPGTAYVYMIYGMYFMLNVVTEKKDFPAAVLIRGVELPPLLTKPACRRGRERAARLPARQGVRSLDGPGKLTKFLHIDKSLNGHNLTLGKKLWLEPRKNNNRIKIVKSPRIGVDYAKHSKDWKWNFGIKKQLGKKTSWGRQSLKLFKLLVGVPQTPRFSAYGLR